MTRRVPRVVLVSRDRIAPEMAAPGIRCLELGRVLAGQHDVVLAGPPGSRQIEGAPRIIAYDPGRPRAFSRIVADFDVVVAPPMKPSLVSGAVAHGCAWIVDLYNPEPFEGLEYQRLRPRIEQRVRDITRVDRLSFAVRMGSAFICGNERQRDMWLGFLAASRRLSSARYGDDPRLRSLIDVVPCGIPEKPPEPGSGAKLRGNIVPLGAKLLLWNGGLWDWLDPATVIRATALLRVDDPSWVLVLPAMSHRDGSPTAAARAAVELANELRLRDGDGVYFQPTWIPYLERGALLLEADIGVIAHHTTLEARFAHRIRMLDFLWAGLPVVCSDGDEWSHTVRVGGLGEVVPAGDAKAFADAVRRVASNGKAHYAPALRAEASTWSWSRVAKPLLALIDVVMDAPRPRLGLPTRSLAARYSAAAFVERRWNRR
jgi:glycosyltransferase involved in cell wall biosynthesis